ncbi:HAMP domain-containing histidine kinase [Pseudonocardia sp. DSM 110487]|uniref:sensor histidine kinase n=1 Tax=Pseudonocardia sp. DSM 110487 TaxID=2865833 RepID=UPI001C6A0446|nr:HAMP domain-containing sensor histidine kinase [Pseudonocardia sp. DSM 110487]QYN34376.1 HAMP domain-containing histidine kinase [Pseudonocardia sp. DSM 110487]
MRRRLLVVLLAFALAAVAGFAVPLLQSTAAGRTQAFVLTRAGDLDRFAALAQQATGRAGAGTLAQEVQAHHTVYGEGVAVVDRSGRAIVEAGLRADDPAVVAAVDAALRNQPAARQAGLRPWSTGPILFARPIGTGTQVGGAVVLRAEPAAAAADITAAWVAVLLGALLAAAACAALALLLARWVLRPIRELAAGVGEVAAGHPGAHVSPRAGPTELRALAAAFNRMSDAVATSAEEQRRLVADTSHQLRNPLAALRLRVDTLDPHVAAAGRATYHSTVVELDRLEALLDGLLDLAAAESRATALAVAARPDDRTELTAVVAERLDAWRPAAVRAGVGLHASAPDPVEAACTASEVEQLLDVLLDNAVKYGGRGATVEIAVCRGDGLALLEVRDDGPGLPAEQLRQATQRYWRAPGGTARGSGLGLPIAERLVTARGGTLRVSSPPDAGLVVTIELPA